MARKPAGACMKFCAVRHKKTKEILPSTKYGKGSPFWNPTTNTTPRESIPVPRLFPNILSAKGFISAWARGTYRYDKKQHILIVENRDGRRKEDLEIIFVNIEVVEEP